MVPIFFFTIIYILLSAEKTFGVKDVQSQEIQFSEYVRHYQDLKCSRGHHMGRLAYVCDLSTNSGLCKYRNKYYGIGEFLEDDDFDGECIQCSCVNTGRDNLGFLCTNKKCENQRNVNRWRVQSVKSVTVTVGEDSSNEIKEHFPEEYCLDQYALGRCCKVNTVCGDDIRNLARCHVDEKLFMAGERFMKGCNKCICGATGSATCRPRTCATDLRYAEEARASCAPVYDSTDTCCPVAWKCPHAYKLKVESSGRESVSSVHRNMQCQYGFHTVNIGERIITEDECLNCQCQVPPLVTCVNVCHTPE